MANDFIRDRLGIPRSEDSFALTSRTVLIVGRIRELEANTFWLRVSRALVAIGSRADDSIKQDRECLVQANGR